jgi:hypothetical protein
MAFDMRRQPSYWEDEDENNPFSLKNIAARQQPAGFNPAVPRAVFPGPRPTAESMAEAGPFAGSDPLPALPPGPAVPKLPGSLKEDDWISAPDPFITDWNTAAAKRDAQRAEKPLLHDKQYDLPAWQKAMMVAANAAGSLVNAGRRTHVDLIDQKTLMRRPKYEAALDSWETQAKSLDSELSSMTTKYQMKRQSQQDEMAARREKEQRRLNDAMIAEREARAADLAEDKRKPPADMMGPGGHVWNPEKKEWYPNSALPPTATRRTGSQTEEEKFGAYAQQAQRMVEAGIIKEGSMEHRYMIANGQLPSPHYERASSNDHWDQKEAAKQEEFKRKERKDIHDLEYGKPNQPGLHDQLNSWGAEQSKRDKLKPKPNKDGTFDTSSQAYKDWAESYVPPDPQAESRKQVLLNNLQGVYDRKYAIGDIDIARYTALTQGLKAQAEGKAPSAATSGGQTRQTAAPAATPAATQTTQTTQTPQKAKHTRSLEGWGSGSR